MDRRIDLNPLMLDKETIAKLDEAQLQAISGGAGDDSEYLAGTTCNSAGSCVGGTTCAKANSC